jgi:glycosyltransferase involved in cell wall biosynthesis
MPIDAIFCVSSDPWGESRGGQTTFARQMLGAFEDRIAVASITAEKLPLRKWSDRSFNGKNIKFLNIGKVLKKQGSKPIIPMRYRVYRYAKRAMPSIRSLGVRNLFIESPEWLFASSNYFWENVCYRLAGVNNPFSNSRYIWAKYCGEFLEKKMFNFINKIKVDALLASADQNAIDDFIMRSKGMIDKRLVHQFPTRVDIDKFKFISKEETRAMLKLKNDKLIIVSCGRLSWIKGWDLILDTAYILKKRKIDFQLFFVGNGEDHKKVIKKAQNLGIVECIKITGFIPHAKVGIYLNASDVCVVASHREGWSLAMLEMLACGKRIVSTNVSGAEEMIRQGKNGFIIKERNPRIFADAIINALELKDAKKISMEIATRYSTKNLATDIGRIWNPLFLPTNTINTRKKVVNAR